MKKPIFAFSAVLALAACQTDTGNGNMGQLPSGGNMGQQAASAIPDVGFDSSVSNAAIQSCQSALSGMTQAGVEVVGTESSQAAVTVYMTVGAQRAPWRCNVSNNGRDPDLMFLGSEGNA